MRPLFVIVADDLTGAADCGVACTAAGLSTVVVLSDPSRAKGLAAEAIAFDADTRRESPERAAAVTARAVHELCADQVVRVLYKKIDSTLRGNFAVEIGAACRAYAERRGKVGAAASAPPFAIVAPAFPAAGRTTRGGRLFVQDIPLEETEVWRQEKIGGVADVPALLRAHGGLRTGTMELETIRAGVRSVTAALARHSADGAQAVVCDADTDNDLQVIAQAAAQLSSVPVFAGSAGLAHHLPSAFGLTRKGRTIPGRKPASPVNGKRGQHPDRPDPGVLEGMVTGGSRLLFVVGSMSEISRQQLALLALEPGIQVFTVPPATLRGGADRAEWQSLAQRAGEALDAGRDVALAIGIAQDGNLGEGAFLSKMLAQFALPLTSRLNGLFCTGGETARALLNAAGVVGIRLFGEVEPGVPLGTGEGGRTGLPIITKAGAFGDSQTLLRCRATLRSFADHADLS